MSVLIQKDNCRSCNKCLNICPGSLIKKDEDGKAFIKYPQYCWGCTSCLKECKFEAIKLYLGADIGGRGTLTYIENSKDSIEWIFEKNEEYKESIKINKNESNKY